MGIFLVIFFLLPIAIVMDCWDNSNDYVEDIRKEILDNLKKL